MEGLSRYQLPCKNLLLPCISFNFKWPFDARQKVTMKACTEFHYREIAGKKLSKIRAMHY